MIGEIGKNVAGDGADPNVTGRYPTPYPKDGPKVARMVYLDLTHETGGNANGAGMADVLTARLESKVHRPSTYMNALTSTTPAPVKLQMVMHADRLAVAAALQMLEGVSPGDARIVRIKNTPSSVGGTSPKPSSRRSRDTRGCASSKTRAPCDSGRTFR